MGTGIGHHPKDSWHKALKATLRMTIKNGWLLSKGLLGAVPSDSFSRCGQNSLLAPSGLRGTLPAWRPSREMYAEHAACDLCRLLAPAGWRLLLPALIRAAAFRCCCCRDLLLPICAGL